MAGETDEETSRTQDDIKATMGSLIERLRTDAGLSKTELGSRLFRNRTTVSNWEAGRQMPGQDAVDLLKNVFSQSADEIQALRDEFVATSAGTEGQPPPTADRSAAAATVTTAATNPAESGEPAGRRMRSMWAVALPVLLLLAASGIYLLLSGGDPGSLEGCSEPHPIVTGGEIAAEITGPTDPIPKIAEDGAFAGTYSGVLGEEQLWLFIMAIDVSKYWPSEQPMALDRANKTWRHIGGSVHVGNDDPGQAGRRFEIALGLVEPDAIGQMGEANEIGGWTVDQLPEGVTLLTCASVYRA